MGMEANLLDASGLISSIQAAQAHYSKHANN
jgi:hypothetical protein